LSFFEKNPHHLAKYFTLKRASLQVFSLPWRSAVAQLRLSHQCQIAYERAGKLKF
jgi:hypothetical protein